MPRARYLILVIVVGMFVGCSGQSGETNDQAAAGAADSTEFSQSEGAQRIPDPIPQHVFEGIELRPAFDEEGAVTELAVAPGEYFDIYIIAAHPAPYSINGAAFRLELPVGVEVLGSLNFSNQVMTIGSYKENLQLAFPCEEGGERWIVKFACRTGEAFAPGEVKTENGVNHTGVSFIGFSTCSVEDVHYEPEMLPSVGGAANLTLK